MAIAMARKEKYLLDRWHHSPILPEPAPAPVLCANRRRWDGYGRRKALLNRVFYMGFVIFRSLFAYFSQVFHSLPPISVFPSIDTLDGLETVGP